MRTLLRQLSSEAIENCVTCLNYHFDKVIFFGYKEIIDEESINISTFLKKDLFVSNVKYYELNNDLDEIENSINTLINNDEYYIDITGSDGICQIALSNVGYRKNIPMHIYDVKSGQVFNIDKNIKGSILDLNKRIIKLNINKYIKMLGGIVLKNRHKDNKTNVNDKNIQRLIEIKHKYNDIWTAFCFVMQQIKSNSLHSPLKAFSTNIKELLYLCRGRIKEKELYNILNDLSENKLINNYNNDYYIISFDYCSMNVMQSILEAGAILEEEVYKHESKDSDDCEIGIHLDWDGVIGSGSDGDVINEIDVLRLDQYVLTFISCKNTKRIDKNALYELETVTRRFGGKYAKMKLVSDASISITDKQRAKLIGIELITLDELLEG